jgi:hypothetical protein
MQHIKAQHSAFLPTLIPQNSDSIEVSDGGKGIFFPEKVLFKIVL